MNHLLVIKKFMAISMPIMLTLVILLSTSGSATAQENRVAPGRNESTAPSQQQGPTDPAELEAFLDKELAREMEKHHIAGAAISVVKDGELFFAKGYGDADLDNKIPVDPEQTILRIGSVGKLFTWTAVMQLAEQGKLDLDADVNTYLDFRIPDTYPEPITLKHLMTHTSGFEDRLRESVVSDPNDLVPTREWLISNMPARVSPPGAYASYSNYNAMLAGYIVARVSGEPYDQYIQEHILNPLGMAHSTAQSPLPPDLRAHASVGYTYEDGAFQAFPDYTAQPAVVPSGAHQASVTDMARFMIAHLQDGRYSDANAAEARILKETTAQQMRSTLYTPDPRLLGTAYGFFDFSDNGQRTLGHSGYLPPMYSLLLLLPDQNLGVYVVYNSEGGGELTLQHLGFQRAFFDHYYPAPAVKPIQPPADFAERAGRFEGLYGPTQGSYTTIDKVGRLFSAVEISHSGDGTLLFTIAGYEWRFVEVEPLYFRQIDGPDGPFSIVFREDDQGRITHMFTDLTPMFAFERLNWYETPGFNMALALGCVLIFLSMILVAAIRLIRNRRLSDYQTSGPRGVRVAYSIIVGICVLNLLFVAGTVLWGNQPNVLSGTSMIYKIVLGLGVLAAVLTVGALVNSVLAWMNSYWGIAARVHYTLVTVAAVAFVWFLNYWNLFGWRF
jgi:CubicO group peptidase (beta-lactamase class C family)